MPDVPVPRLAVVGHPNKGKSSLVATLAQDDSVALGPIAPFVSGAYARTDERWAVLDLNRLVESPVFLQAAE